jgi:hypothetical protein
LGTEATTGFDARAAAFLGALVEVGRCPLAATAKGPAEKIRNASVQTNKDNAFTTHLSWAGGVHAVAQRESRQF